MTTNHIHTLINKALGFVGLLLVLGLFVGISSNDAYAQQAPPANSQIGNTASATYIDSGGNSRTVTSNTVETIVQQVAGVSISAGLTKSVSPGGQITFTHTITNNGNGSDSFTLAASEVNNGDFDYGSISIYPDADGNGTPDNFTTISTTPNIDAGDSYGIVIVANIPATASDGDEEDIEVTATSTYSTGVSATTDPDNKAIIEEDAVIDVQKSVSQSTANVGDELTYTLTFSNNGNSDGVNLRIQDPLPSGVTYNANSGRWSSSGTTVLGDASGGTDDPSGIEYYFKAGNGTNPDSVVAVISSLGAGASGTIQFDVTVDNGTEGTSIVNYAQFKHRDLNSFTNTNNATVTINESYSVKVHDDITDDEVTEGPVNQGATVNFVNKFTNDGSTTDTYNITLANTSNYPSGTTFTLYKANSSDQPTSPFTDTNGDGTADTGPLAAGESITVILQVNLPSNGTGDGPFEVDKTLTSVNDGSVTATITDILDGITGSSVDLTNYSDADDTDHATGIGQGPEATPQNNDPSIPATNPGTTVDISLVVTNTSNIDDSYQLAVDQSVSGTSLGSAGLPSGWSVTFYDGNSQITSTGTIDAGDNKEITARVSIPAGADPVTEQSLYFRVLSSSTGAEDIIHNAVTVNTYRNVSLTSNNTGQIFPGGSKTYAHTISINSNVDENDGTNSDFKINLSNSGGAGFTAQVYYDADGDGAIETADGDILITTASGGQVDLTDQVAAVTSLGYGDQVRLIVKVTANSGVADGSTNTTTLTLVDGEGNISTKTNEDITTVVAGLLTVEKFQSSDGNTYTKSDLNVLPGGVVYYKIVVSNDGAAAVTNVVVNDNIPSYTKLQNPVSITEDDVTEDVTDDSGLTTGDVGTISVGVSELAPGESFEFTFSVKVDGNGAP
ncbi:beta strand repeat-containing protein [Gracilimonas mengyeensis]|uniref:Conserved repeat domain-containing protein n=1 Tax=Gracilimonas mengyeensis TaxID=1302730 RepID=A0A521FJC3_9BACT|nr:DUF11 domain-containing protein [Gracilimonas mengyeensis]SMO96226.1 conserved repeat domain-containing protein [Gracilimonas mengyeensis]